MKFRRIEFLLLFGVLRANAQEIEDVKIWSCKTKVDKCTFPSNQFSFAKCVNDKTICSSSGGESNYCEDQTPDPDSVYYCNAKLEAFDDIVDYPWVKCDDDCFENNEAKTFTEQQSCAAKSTECIFPFKHHNILYENYTSANLVQPNSGVEKFKWCATSVNPDKSMKVDKWAIVDEATCQWIQPASGELSGGGIAGIIIVIVILLGVGGFAGYAYKEKKFCFNKAGQQPQQVPLEA